MSDVCRRVAALTDATVQFGLVPKEHWVQPSWINETQAAANRESMAKNNIIYGGASFILLT
jgi:alpha 1,2-mannosyltransferase